MLDLSWATDKAPDYQLCLYPALMLLFVVPSVVSPVDPAMLTPPNNFR